MNLLEFVLSVSPSSNCDSRGEVQARPEDTHPFHERLRGKRFMKAFTDAPSRSFDRPRRGERCATLTYT